MKFARADVFLACFLLCATGTHAFVPLSRIGKLSAGCCCPTEHGQQRGHLFALNFNRQSLVFRTKCQLNAVPQIADLYLRQSLREALGTMQVMMEPDFFSSKTSGSLKNLHKKAVKAVTVAPSSIPGAGMGMFAQINIKKGTIISFYPAHGMGADFDHTSICMGGTADSELYFATQGQQGDIINNSANYLHYLIGNRPLAGNEGITDPLFIDVDPNKKDSPGWLSHYINDGATVQENSQNGVLNYYDSTQLTKNCVHVPFGPSPIMATVTTRKVKKGEELFTSYGCSYWLEALLEDGEECTDITEPIQLGVKQTAQDLFSSMQELQVSYEKEGAQLQSAFEKNRT